MTSDPVQPWPLGGSRRGRPDFQSYTNKHGARRAVLTFDYADALAIATGDDEKAAELVATVARAARLEEGQEKPKT